MISPRAHRHPIPIQVGFENDPADYDVLNWSQTGMLVAYDGPLRVGDTGMLVRMAVAEDEGFSDVTPRPFRVIRQSAWEMAIDFANPTFVKSFELSEGLD